MSKTVSSKTATSSSVVDQLSRGTFSFLRPEADEIRTAIGGARLPDPQSIYLADEAATPLVGYPMLLTPRLGELGAALIEYLSAERIAQLSYLKRESFDSKAYAAAWERYRTLLEEATYNAMVSSHGRGFPALVWLYHSLPAARKIKEIPRELLRADLESGRQHGDAVKYKVFFKWIDRVVTLSFDVAHRVGGELGEDESSFFPTLLSLMRDNVLILTEDYISPDLSELASYFDGCLQADGRSLRRGLAALTAWHRALVASDRQLRSAIVDLIGADPEADPDRLLHRRGYVTFLSRHPAYDPSQLLDAALLKLWESLLGKLKEYEAIHALRKMIVPLASEEGALVSRDRSINATWVGGPAVLRVSSATRPIDFMTSWVVDPLVERYGLVYDISDFSSTLSLLGRSERSVLDEAFKKTARFQRKINLLAASLRIRPEKYLGDGAFYSGRNGRRMLQLAILLQRAYRDAVDQGFHFDRGLRLALNYGEYRLLPLDRGPGERRSRYEFFGHGLVELSRLSTGKKTREIDEIKNYLLGVGYPEAAVSKFFAPLTGRDRELVSKVDVARRFYAYVNRNHTLVNEGIVATEPFVSRLGSFEPMYYAAQHGRHFIAVALEEEVGGRLLVGVRKLGFTELKGLDRLPVYEIVDGAGWDEAALKQIPVQDLAGALDRLFASTVSAQSRARAKARQEAEESS